MASQPLVSILTPSFNQASWLDDNLRSVADQTYAPLEHIIMDGGSTDETLKILRSRSASIRWDSEPDKGQSEAINKAFRRSQGEIIGWLNSDDAYYSSTSVETCVRFLEANPEIDVVYGHAAVVNARGEIVRLRWAPPFSHRLLLVINFITQPSAFIRRRVLTENRLVDEQFNYVMDRELWLRLAQTSRFACVGRIIAIDRLHPGRKSVAEFGDLQRDRERVDRIFGGASGGLGRFAEKALITTFRLMALSLVNQANGPRAFPGPRENRVELVKKQLAFRGRRVRTDL